MSGSVLEIELDALESDRPFGNHLALFRECKLHFSRKFAPRVVMAILGGYALCMRRERTSNSLLLLLLLLFRRHTRTVPPSPPP